MTIEENLQSGESSLIIKGRLKSVSNNLYGQFFIQFNNKNNIGMFNSVISTFSDLYDALEPHSEWTKYHEVIADIKWQGKFNTSMTASIMDQIKDFANSEEAALLFDQAINYDYDNLDNTLFDLINRIIHDKNLTIETGIQEITSEDLQKLEEERKNEKESNQQDDDSIQDDTIILSCKAILAPVKGKPIYELRIGNIIMVKILPGPDKNNYYIDVLELKQDNVIKPVPGTVVDIKSGSAKKDPIEIIVEISPGVFGKCIEEEQQVKLKMYDPQVDGQLFTDSGDMSSINTLNTSNEVKGESKGTMVMLLIALFILLLFIVIILLMW